MTLKIDKKRSIGEAAKELGIQEYVIRFWETKFGDYIKPTIGSGGRRYFFDKDMKVLNFIKNYLYDKGYTIKGLQNLLKNENIDLCNSINTNEKKENIINTENFKYVIDNKNNDSVKNTNINSNKYVNIDINIKEDIKKLRNKLNIFYEKLKSI